MPAPTFMILYANNAEASGAFYADLFGRQPVEASPAFVLFALDGGLMLGLWSRHTVEPAVTAPAGGSELACSVDGTAAVDAIFADWTKRGLTILQPPTAMDFGRTFVALDPDGNRLRVFAPARG